MSYWSLLVSVVQVIAAVARHLQRRSLIAEGERRQMEAALRSIAASADLADRIWHDSDDLTSEQLDEDLMR